MSKIEKVEEELEMQTIGEINSLIDIQSWTLDAGIQFECWNFSYNGTVVVTGDNKLTTLKRALIWARERGSNEEYEIVDHPKHYGGAEAKHEAISVIEEWELGFHLGNVVKYISRAGKKPDQDTISDLKKARWYLDRYIDIMETKDGLSGENRNRLD